jgi:purine-binding chemotaxis protein CheW
MSAESQKQSVSADATGLAEGAAAQLIDLVPFTAGERIFAVFADHIDGTAEAKTAAALPNCPPAVIGVVCVRGRMLTILDPLALSGAEPASWGRIIPCVIALRGDEQLGLAAQGFLDTITIAAVDIDEPAETRDGNPETAVEGIARHGGQEITVLKVANLFTAAVQRKERRRRRF